MWRKSVATARPRPHRCGALRQGGTYAFSRPELHLWTALGPIQNPGEMLMRKYYRLLAGFAFAAALATAASAQQAGGTKVGVLTSQTSASIGFIVGSHQRIRCTYAPDSGGRPEYYAGYINRVG